MSEKNGFEKEALLEGVIDIHIHTNPDVRKRRLDDLELAAEARRVKARAVVIKAHFLPTMDRAAIAQKATPGIEVYGGLVLNPHVGGLNRLAVDTALKLGARIIWLPTSWSSNERLRHGKSDGVVCVRDGQVVPELIDILSMIAERNVALATGHLTPEEILIVVEEAKKRGVQKIVINHPEWTTVDMPIAMQKTLAPYGVFFERCYARNVGGKYESNFRCNLEAMEAVGFESTIVATDGGQTENPIWSEALASYIDFLLQAGVPHEAVRRMTVENPARVLGLGE